MASQTVERVHDPAFLDRTLEELHGSGFVTDEHDFAPYKDAITTFAPQIEAELRERDPSISLESGIIKNHSKAGYAYYIFNRGRFPSRAAAERAISAWLDKIYAGHEE